MARKHTLGLVLSLALLWQAGARSNDSSAEIEIGGLTITRSDVVRLDSEELTVSRDRISVSYRFTNTSSRDVETLVAFPLPDQSFDVEVPVIDYVEQLGFRTTVEGEPVPLDVVVRASFGGRDITDRLAELGLPNIPVHDVFNNAVNVMPETTRKALIAEGLIVEDGNDGVRSLWAAKWSLKTTVTRKQVDQRTVSSGIRVTRNRRSILIRVLL